MTKADKIREFLLLGWKTADIAREVGCGVNHVCVVRWNAAHPDYKAAWQRDKRASDPEYVERERKQQRTYLRGSQKGVGSNA